MVTDPELWTAPPEVKEKIHLLYQRSEFVERSMKHFLGRWAGGKRGLGGACLLPPWDPCSSQPPGGPALSPMAFLALPADPPRSVPTRGT